jgi:hypothetical protein
MDSETSGGFTLRFGRTARTLEYQDAEGRVVLTFDVSWQSNKCLVIDDTRQLPRGPRCHAVFERAKKFLESRGYEVELPVSVRKPAA